MGFEVPAEAYDRYMGRYSTLLSGQFAEFAGIAAGQRVLDVGSGPGALTGELVRRLRPELVTAVDPSEAFVAAARSRHPGTDVRQARAEELPFPDGVFDATLAQLVIHFLAEPIHGLAEMARVTRRDGVVAACVWDFAGGRGPLGPFWEAARELDPAAVDESDLPGARVGHLGELFTAAGLHAVEQTILSISVRHHDFDDWWEPFTGGVGPGGAYVAGLTAAARAALRERCRALLPSGSFTLSAGAWAARGLARARPPILP